MNLIRLNEGVLMKKQIHHEGYNYVLEYDNNSLIMFPAWVEHGVSKVSINDSDYFDGYGRYAITSFFGNKEKE